MKKIITLIVVAFLITSCGESKELTDAKDDLLDRAPIVEEDTTNTDTQRQEQTLIEQKNMRIKSLTDTQYLDFDSISDSDMQSGEIVLSWTADREVEKIEVLFSNSDSDFPDDEYTLQTYKKGSTSFKYVASSKNKVLDYWENVYIFRAYVWKEFSETELTIAFQEEVLETWTETKLIWDENNTLLIDLPTSSKYGEPMQLGQESFTYTDIKGLEIIKEILPEVTCETLTDFLGERMNVWYYWNTCRDIVKEKWIKFNVIRLDGEKYIYERHYIDFVNGLYGTYELETGEGVDSDTIADKNTELKDAEFETIDLVDGLIKDILNA